MIVLLILAVLISFITCFSILSEKNGNPKLQWILFVILFGIGLHYLNYLMVITGLISNFPFFLRGLVPFIYLPQPAIYFYVLINLDENYTFSKKDLLHLVPTAYAIIDNWGFYTGGPTHWQFWSDSVSSNYGNIANYPGSLFKAKYNFIFRSILYISYTLMAWRYFIKNLQINQELKDQFVLKWLKMFLIVISIYVVFVASSSIYNSNVIRSINDRSNYFLTIPLIIVSLSIIILSAYILFNPILLYGLPKINFKTISDNQKSLSKFKSIEIQNEKNEDSEYILAITIITEIKEKELYKNTDFSMAIASEYFSIPVHHISFIINKNIKKSFPDIICEFRIDHAIKLLKDNRNKKYTMEAIGNLSGFNSRTTFYVSFKKITGISPNEYLQNLKIS